MGFLGKEKFAQQTGSLHILSLIHIYGKEYAKRFKSTVSLVYTGQSGAPYNVTYYGDLNGDGSNGNDLVFIPTDEQIDAMQFKATAKLDADQQKADLKAFLRCV